MASDKGLRAVQDEMYNLIVKIPGSEGYENSPAVILQAHLDMVCEKNKSSEHDFVNEPINVRAEGDWVTADATTLGADNGIGVAYCMALIELAGTDGHHHPPLEIVLTTLEETGLEGATFMSAKELSAKRLINLDTEQEGFLRTGCAGGSKPTIRIPVTYTDVPQGSAAFTLEVKGLKGGHSGMEIDKMRANANRLLARLLDGVICEGVYLASVSGGLKDNAITREAEAELYAAADFVEFCIDKIESLGIELKNEYRLTDAGMTITLTRTDRKGGRAFSHKTAWAAVSALLLLPYGPLEMSADFPGLVEVSNNIGVVTTGESEVCITCAVRSNVASRKEFVKRQIDAVARLAGAEIEHRADYPAWEYQPESELRGIFTDVYRKMYGKEPTGGVIHAGIECGLFAEKIPGLDMISFGPNMYDVHTPDEKVSIGSTGRMWEYLLGVLAALR
jgi:dipeptidase D